MEVLQAGGDAKVGVLDTGFVTQDFFEGACFAEVFGQDLAEDFVVVFAAHAGGVAEMVEDEGFIAGGTAKTPGETCDALGIEFLNRI